MSTIKTAKELEDRIAGLPRQEATEIIYSVAMALWGDREGNVEVDRELKSCADFVEHVANVFSDYRLTQKNL
jgi:hypothetical protein